MKAWFENLDTREQRLLMGAAVILAVLILYLAIWEPLQKGVASLQSSTSAQRATLEWMRGAAQEVALLRGQNSGSTRPASGQSLLSLVDRTAKARRLGEALKRVQPDGERQVRVWLEGAKFDDLIGWLVTLDANQGVHINNGVFEAQEATGLVNARLVFEVAG